MLARLINYFILAFLFLLPWQTRWIYGPANLDGKPWEFGTLSFYGTEILLWLIIILTGIKLFGNRGVWTGMLSREHLKRYWKNIIFAFILVFFLTYFFKSSADRDITTQFIDRLLGGICFLFCVAVSDTTFRKLSMAFWASAVIQGLLSFGQFATQKVVACKWLGLAAQNPSDIGVAVIQFDGGRWLRSYGSFGWPNSLGVYLAAAIILGLIIYSSYTWDKKYKALIIGGQAVILIGLFLTFSRAAWLSAVIGLIVYLAIYLSKIGRKILLKNIALHLGVLAFTGAVITAVLFSAIMSRFGNGNYLEEISVVERAEQYSVASSVIQSNWLRGTGPGLYTKYLFHSFPTPLYGTYQPVHNIYILALAEVGLIMFFIWLFCISWIMKKIRQNNEVFLAVNAVLLIAGAFDHFLWSLYAGQMLFWSIFSLGLAKKDEVPNNQVIRT